MTRKFPNNQISLKISGFTPSTLPSARLAQYLLDLNSLVGSTTKVHFKRLGKGSAQIIQWAEPSALPAIRKRLIFARAKGEKTPLDITEAYDRLNRRLIEDNSAAKLKIGNDRVLDFPGSRTEARGIIGPVTQSESLDGQLFRIGGVDATVPVHLKDGEHFHYCTATVEIAKKLAPFLYGQTVRLFGIAHWYRYPQGYWKLEHFRVENFQPLEDIPLGKAVEILRAIPHDDWDETLAEKIDLRQR